MSPEQFKYRKLTTKDIERFFDIGERQALRIKKAIREAFGLPTGNKIPFPQFYSYVNLPIEEVSHRLGWSK